jgi:hypothetical protein
MKLVIKLLGILFILSGISLLIDPKFIFGWIEENLEYKSLYISAIIGRLVLGTLFIIAAKESKYRRVVKYIGYFVIIAAFILIFIGHESFKEFVSSVIPVFKPYAPVVGFFISVFGAFLIYAFTGNKNLKSEE